MSDFQATVEKSAEIASRWSIRYYKTIDAANPDAIQQMYSPDARIAWNGTPLQVGEPLKDFWTRMPRSATQVEVLDAHPLPRAAGNTAPLQVTVTVTGKQSFYDPASTERLVNKPNQSLPIGRKHTSLSEDQIEQLPRVFHQSFILAPARDAAGNVVLDVEAQPVYIARSDCYRFVG